MDIIKNNPGSKINIEDCFNGLKNYRNLRDEDEFSLKKIMKKMALILCICIIGCQQTPDEIKKEIKQLEMTRDTLDKTTKGLRSQLESENVFLNSLRQETKFLTAVKENKPIKYILTLELSQSHFTLDIGTHLKDSMNTAEFSIAVDKDLYDSVSVGKEMVNEFRMGSALFKGSLGSWHVMVKNKTVSY